VYSIQLRPSWPSGLPPWYMAVRSNYNFMQSQGEVREHPTLWLEEIPQE
jgi:hypothetical protein